MTIQTYVQALNNLRDEVNGVKTETHIEPAEAVEKFRELAQHGIQQDYLASGTRARQRYDRFEHTAIHRGLGNAREANYEDSLEVRRSLDFMIYTLTHKNINSVQSVNRTPTK